MKLLRELGELRDVLVQLGEAVARANASLDGFEERWELREAASAQRLEEARRKAREEFAGIDPEALADLLFGPRPNGQ